MLSLVNETKPYKNGDKIAFTGSVNETGMGWHQNTENFTAFRSWGDDTNNQGIVDNQNDLDFIISEANYFQELGSDYDTWSLFYYNQELELVDFLRTRFLDVPI